MSVQANELRLGNYYGVDGAIYQVDVLGVRAIHGILIKPPEGQHTNGRVKTGIPLTPQLLGKCGFVEKDRSDNVHSIFSLNDFHLDFDWRRRQYYSPMEENNGEWVTYGSSIQYLHQLQNLYFALTGEELQVTL